jgi:hypothetical protein
MDEMHDIKQRMCKGEEVKVCFLVSSFSKSVAHNLVRVCVMWIKPKFIMVRRLSLVCGFISLKRKNLDMAL